MADLTPLRESVTPVSKGSMPPERDAGPHHTHHACDAAPVLQSAPVGLWRRLLARLPAPCPLCTCASRGGFLCDACHRAVYDSMRQNPQRCPACQLPWRGHGHCADCVMHPPVYDRLIVAFEYAAPGDALVRQFKSARHFVLAPMLASLLANAVRNAAPVPSRNTIVVPVPASCAGIVHRGFNPAAEIARYLARQLGMRYRPGLLRRVREAPRQASLPRAERMRSVLSLYDCPQRVDGLDIAVVDDVITTGSTLNSIARVLKDAGAASVCAVVLARTPRD